MKTKKNIYKIGALLGLLLITSTSCDREISDEAEFATYSNNPDIFVDGFVGGLDYFPFGNSFAEAFSVEESETYLGTASMRFDIPVFGVGYGGATFPSASPRNLTEYDALTFWAKASQGADINEIGFGINGDTNNKYQVTTKKLALTTNWTKYTIPIPDASKLIDEVGMFWYSEGAVDASDEGGYTFWIDELRFEKLGTIGQQRPMILNGEDRVEESFVGSTITLDGLSETYNLESGEDIKETITPSYFTFKSSNTSVAMVSDLGVVSISGEGTSIITATLAGVETEGSLTINVGGDFESAPLPTRDVSNVLSLYSDSYSNVNIDTYNGDFGDSQTTITEEIIINGNGHQLYTNLNFAAIVFQNPVVDASNMGNLHLDMFIPDELTENLTIEIRDRGTNGMIDTNTNNGAPIEDDKRKVLTLTNSDIVVGEWNSIDIPLDGDLATQRDNIAEIVFAGNSDFRIDNVYFYTGE